MIFLCHVARTPLEWIIMKSERALTFPDLAIALLVSIVLTALLFLVGRWTKETTPFKEHITGFHGIDCSANASSRKYCKELGLTQP